MLLWLESGDVHHLFAEVEEAAELHAQLGQSSQIGRRQGGGTSTHVRSVS